MNFEIIKTPDFTWKVYRLEEYESGFGSDKEKAVRQYWVATFEQASHAKMFVEILKGDVKK